MLPRPRIHRARRRDIPFRRALLPALLAACLAGLGLAPPAAAQQGFEREIVAWLEKSTGGPIDPEQLKIGYVDLNGDGGVEALALYTHVNFCDGAGCRGWVFQRGGTAVTLVGTFSGFTLPVVSLEGVSAGWPDLIVYDPLARSNRQLRFDGSMYR